MNSFSLGRSAVPWSAAIPVLCAAALLSPGEARAGRDAADLRVEQGAIGDRQTLRVVYPGRRVIYPEMGFRSSSSVDVASDGTFRNRHNLLSWRGRRVTVAGSGSGTHAHADLVVRVPAGTDLTVYLQAGRAEARDLEADLRIEASVGLASGCESLVADTGSGGVRILRADR